MIYNENSSGPRKELNLKAQGLANIRLENGTEKFSSDVSQPALLSNNPLDAALGKGSIFVGFQVHHTRVGNQDMVGAKG